MRFECWDVEDAENVVPLFASHALAAAECFVEDVWEPMDGKAAYEVDVRDPSGVVKSFCVVVEARPMFVASPSRRATPLQREEPR